MHAKKAARKLKTIIQAVIFLFFATHKVMQTKKKKGLRILDIFVDTALSIGSVEGLSLRSYQPN